MIIINVYDFDNTLYDGESMLDFYLYCCRRHPLLFRFVFIVLYTLVRYNMHLVSEEELMNKCRKYVKVFIDGCGDIESLADKFAVKYRKRLKSFYADMKTDNDVIVSASFGFLLRRLMPDFPKDRIVCSEVDLKNKEILSLCFRNEKTVMFAKAYGTKKIENVYTDSLNDLAIMKMAENAYLVKKNKITEYVFKEEGAK